ncbi:protein YIPF5 homolog [Hylaeus volcanicus]|uniref:protein YIPF5 homolog n=1 Tax=Hylaeus volcanicus TaxID=313075 RepID=UPI0023B806F8|nr:protein YIPF5 homolog [Hylaeus volcanicus]
MSGYTGQENYWEQPYPAQQNFDSSGFEQPNQQFEFQTYSDQQSDNYSLYGQKSYLSNSQNAYRDGMYDQDDFTKTGSNGFVDEEEEPPLLEELGIDPDRILQKTLAVLNPFHRRGQIDDANYLLQDSDLAGPVSFCLVLAAFLSIAASKAYFGYVYGLAVISCILMYILLSLMSNTSNITLSAVASILGYCLLPVVALAGLSIFIKLQGSIGLLVAILAVAWATISASRFLSTISGEPNQRLLVAYPCALLYGTFTLIVIF